MERTGDEAHPELLLRLERPAPGLTHMFVMPLGGRVMLSIRFYLYGDLGAAAAAQAEREWTNWLSEKFPTQA